MVASLCWPLTGTAKVTVQTVFLSSPFFLTAEEKSTWETKLGERASAFLLPANTGQVMEPITFNPHGGAMKITSPSLWEALYTKTSLQERSLFHWLQVQLFSTLNEGISQWEVLFLSNPAEAHWNYLELCEKTPAIWCRTLTAVAAWNQSWVFRAATTGWPKAFSLTSVCNQQLRMTLQAQEATLLWSSLPWVVRSGLPN